MRSRDRRDNGSTPKFFYQKRTIEDITNRANRNINEFDSLFLIPLKTFKPHQGENRVRILPSTWSGANHYAYDVHIHRDIGPDHGRYFCLKAMLGKTCGLCDERNELSREGDVEEAGKLAYQNRVFCWVIDRKAEDLGPLIWEMGARQDKDIAGLQVDRSTGEIFLCEDPNEGYDLTFARTGEGLKTRYSSFQFARRLSPLSDDQDKMDEWLQYIAENPIPDVLKFYDNEYIESLYFPSTEKEVEKPKPSPVRKAIEEKARPSLKEELDDDVPPFDPETGELEEEEEDVKPIRPTRRGSSPAETRSATSAGNSRGRSDTGDDDDEEDVPEEDTASQLRDRLLRRQQDRRTP